MFRHGRAVQYAIAVGGPLDVAQPARPVRVAHQVGIKRDRVVAGITYKQNCLMRRRRVGTNSIKLNLKLMMRPAASFMQRACKPHTGVKLWSTSAPSADSVSLMCFT